MRIFPLALIAVGVFGLLKHFGLIGSAWLHLFWPVLLIAIGLAMLARGPRWRTGGHWPLHDRWERRMQRHFGAGWAQLSEDERERFRAGMRQWRGQPAGEGAPPPAAVANPAATAGATPGATPAAPPPPAAGGPG